MKKFSITIAQTIPDTWRAKGLLFLTVLIASLWLWIFFFTPTIALGQVGVISEEKTKKEEKKEEKKDSAEGVPAQPASEQPAPGDIEAVGEEENFARVNLVLTSGDCVVNDVESVALHLDGVVGVDIEGRKNHLIVDYNPAKITPQAIRDALQNKKGCHAPITSPLKKNANAGENNGQGQGAQ